MDMRYDRPKCTHCGRFRYVRDVCYSLHDFPPGHPLHIAYVVQSNTVTQDVISTSRTSSSSCTIIVPSFMLQ